LKLSFEDRLILLGSKLNPDENDLKQMDEMIRLVKDWEYFILQAIHNGVGPIIYGNFSENNFSANIPFGIFSKLKHSYYRSLSRNMILYNHFKNVIKAITSAGVDVIALKGIYLAESVYKDIGLRQMSDIDIMVRKEDAEKCRKILMNCGYADTVLYKAQFIKKLIVVKHLPPLVIDGVSVELHTQVHLDYPEMAVEIDDYWNRSIKVQIAGINVNVLSHEDLLQHLCLHLDEHFDDGKPQLYSLMDIATITNTFLIDWNLLIFTCKKYNCSNRVFRQLFLAHKYFSANIPDNILSIAKLYFDKRVERLFIHYLQHQRKDVPIGTTDRNIQLFKNIKGFRNKCIYLVYDVFPSKSFMYMKYKIKRKYFLIWFYILRIITGVYKLILESIRFFIPSAKSRS
jgi:hypothetical protein